MSEELVTFFKALADASRLKIVGLLAQKPYSVEELAAILDLKPSTISHHLARLAEAGLVSAKAEGYYSVYQLDQEALRKTTRSIFSTEQMSAATENMDLDAYDRKVLADFTLPDGRLKEIPAQRKKLDVVLRRLAEEFEAGRRYSEKEVNEKLSHFHEDTATLRRELVGGGLMQRQSGEYWRTEKGL
jgi:predicted transcriptional regulator